MVKKRLRVVLLYRQGLLLRLPFLSCFCFPSSPFACLHLVFQTKLLLSLLCLVPTCWLCFPSPSLQPGDTGGSGPPRCVFDHSCDLQQTCTRLGRGKHAAAPYSQRRRGEGRFSLPAGSIKTPDRPPRGYTVWPLRNGPPRHRTMRVTQKLTAGK